VCECGGVSGYSGGALLCDQGRQPYLLILLSTGKKWEVTIQKKGGY
jgi:hypothetical protein